jgi:hypothetical protein
MNFGRRIQFDERSRQYPIRALIPETAQPRSYTWSCGPRLDQKDTPRCVGYSWAHELAARPVVIPGITNATGDEMYALAQDNDEWPGNDYDGSSVMGGAKGAVIKGYITQFRWAFGENDLAMAVGYKGPAVLGINWHKGMMYPDKYGIIKPTGQILGGHAILCNGYNVKTGLYRLHNSWGSGWGINGECFLSSAGMAFLLAAQGEACIPVIRTSGVS